MPKGHKQKVMINETSTMCMFCDHMIIARNSAIPSLIKLHCKKCITCKNTEKEQIFNFKQSVNNCKSYHSSSFYGVSSDINFLIDDGHSFNFNNKSS